MKLLRDELSKFLEDFETINDPKELNKLIDCLKDVLDFYDEITEYPIEMLKYCIIQMQRYDATRAELIGKIKACIVCMNHRIEQEGEK